MTRTPEGFLICHSVPIGRTGKQDYLGGEIGLDNQQNQIIEVIRLDEEVFAPAAMASFEGKPFTDEHPSDEVTVDNAAIYTKGMVHNVRKGTGEENDLLLADIIVYDPTVISQIEQGKREVSSGYNCIYEKMNDKQYKQTAIVGNHVALVQKGRAGERVSIKDEKPKQRGDKTMANQSKQSVWGRMMKAFAQDATPEEMEMAVDEMSRACGTDSNPTPQEPPKSEPVGDEGNPLEERIGKLEVMLSQVLQHIQPKQEPDALDSLETELSSKTTGDEDGASSTIEAEEGESGEKAADTATILNQIATMKPIIAQIADPVERKKTSDTFASVLRQQMGLTNIAGDSTYSAIQQVAKQSQAHQAKDSQPDNQHDLGKDWAQQFNPHYNKEGK